MSLIDTLLKEIKETDKEDISSKIDSWTKRCRQEGVSIFALERLLELRFKSMSDLPPRSMKNFSSVGQGDDSARKVDVSSVSETGPRQSQGFFKKLFGKFSSAK